MNKETKKIINDADRILHSLEDGFLRADRDGYIIMANKAIATMCKYESPEAMLGMHIKKLYAYPEEREKMIAEIKAKGKLKNYELELLCKDGSRFWSLNNIKTFFDEEGKLLGTEGVVRELSNIKETEKKLRAANQQLRVSEQQLRASNQQLQASEQQLRAANQQLQASELQIRAANQQLKATENELINKNHALKERLKEITCLYKISQIIEEDENIDKILKNIVDLIPPAWHYPDVTTARIYFRNCVYTSDKFQKTQWKQKADIIVNNQKQGSIEVYYLIKKPELEEGPFLKEERKLIDTISIIIGRAIENILANKKIKASNQQLQASEQQLRAANQQLQASEQQIRAANQQLAANEQQLRANQLKLQKQLETLSQGEKLAQLGYFERNWQTGKGLWSQGFYALLKENPEEVDCTHQQFTQYIYPADIERVESHIKNTLKNHEDMDIEFNLIQADGNVTYIHGIGRNYYDKNGKPLRTIGTFQDITKQKKNELKLRKSEAKFRSYIDHTPVGVFICNEKGKYLEVNKASTKITGYPEQELLQMSIPDLLQENEVEKGIQHFKQVQHQGYARGEIGFVTKDSRNRFWEVAAVKLSNTRFLGFVKDITRRLEKDKELKESELRFQRMLSLVPDMISIHDPDMNIVYSNWNGFGAVPEKKQILNTKCYKTYRGYDEICPDCVAKVVLATCKRFQTEKQFTDGRWVDVRAIPLLDEEGQVELFMEWVRDITERKQAEEKLENMKDALEKKVKEQTKELEDKVIKLKDNEKEMLTMIEELNQTTRKLEVANKNLQKANKDLESFSHSVSHDLRAPLRAINGFTSIILEDYAGRFDTEGKRYGELIKKNCLEMGQLIDDLLAFSRLGRKSLQFMGLNMKSILKSIFKKITTEKERANIDFTVKPLPNIEGDARMIKELWKNLISNSVKYTSKQKNPKISISSEPKDKEITYIIKDNGVGFDMKYADKLFKVFQRLHSDKDFKGTGVGLALAKRIVNRHNGKIWAESKKNEGAVFYITLPKKQKQLSDKED